MKVNILFYEEFCKNKKQNETKKATIRVQNNPGIAAQVD